MCFRLKGAEPILLSTDLSHARNPLRGMNTDLQIFLPVLPVFLLGNDSSVMQYAYVMRAEVIDRKSTVCSLNTFVEAVHMKFSNGYRQFFPRN
jgi:hypothetical protein